MIVAHLDLDAFYAAVEELEQLELRSQPLVVGGDPRGRGVLATANYYAGDFLASRGIAEPVRTSVRVATSRRGALLVYGAVPFMEFGDAWPEKSPVRAGAGGLDRSRCAVPLSRLPASVRRRLDGLYDADAVTLRTERVHAFLAGL